MSKADRFELNFRSFSLFSSKRRSERQTILDLAEAVMAIFCLLNVMDISINKELYDKLDDEDKQFFKLKQKN